MGFFTDTTICIGCKACEVACKNWNGLSSDVFTLSGDSYDNTRELNGENWRHVQFIEQFPEDRVGGRWLLMSDVCKHCVHAGCLEVCPTGAIIRTEYDTVVIQADVCNGCRDCIAACPFGVIEINPLSRTAMKCTLCDRAEWAGAACSKPVRPTRSSSAPSRSCTKSRTSACSSSTRRRETRDSRRMPTSTARTIPSSAG